MRLIDAESLALKLGITNINDCEECLQYNNTRKSCGRGAEFEEVCYFIETEPTIKATIKFETEKERNA